MHRLGGMLSENTLTDGGAFMKFCVSRSPNENEIPPRVLSTLARELVECVAAHHFAYATRRRPNARPQRVRVYALLWRTSLSRLLVHLYLMARLPQRRGGGANGQHRPPRLGLP